MNQEKKQLIVFGYGLAVILAFVSLSIWRHHGWVFIHIAFFLCILSLIFATRFKLDLLMPLYRAWMKAAHLIGTVFTAAILSVLFYVVFGITGIILRLLRKDLLERQIDKNAHSYWIKREQTDFEKTHYTRQF